MRPFREFSVDLRRSGMTLRGKSYDGPSTHPWLLLHGWMDNCGSFDALCEHLDALQAISIDLPGHGLSDNLKAPMFTHLDCVAYLAEFAQSHGWKRFNLIGHSLGGVIASLLAATLPEHVENLVLLDTLGPVAATAEDGVSSVGRYLRGFLRDHEYPEYRSVQDAIDARVKLGDIDRHLAAKLAERGVSETDRGGYVWHGDYRFRLPFLRSFTEEQALAYLRNIRAQTLLLRAERTILTEACYGERMNAVRNFEVRVSPGGHYLHMEHPERVARAIWDYARVRTQTFTG